MDLPGPRPLGPGRLQNYGAPPGGHDRQPGRLPQDAAKFLAKKAVLTWRKGNSI